LKNIGKDCDIPSETVVGALEFSNEEPEPQSLVSVQEVGFVPSAPEDRIFWLLNLSLYKILENNLQEAQFAVDEALKLAHGGCYQHCLREHAAVQVLELSRRFCQNVKKHRLRQLILNT
jgi:hypothetical protein